MQSGLAPESEARPTATGVEDTKHIESIAALVCELLGAKVKPWLQRRLRAWPHVLEDADDLGQLAALAFIEGYRQGRVMPDPETRRHTASSVSAYLWGICNHIFIDTLRRNRHLGEQQEVSPSESSNSSQETSPLEKILLEAREEDDESRLWAVLAAVRNRCKPQDIVTTYLLGCGFSSGEVRRLLEISINMPSIAIKRVGQAVREILGLDPTTPPEDPPGTKRDLETQSRSGSPSDGASASSSPFSTLGLLLQKSFSELVQRLDSPPARNMFLREAVAALGPDGQTSVEQSLADRMHAIRVDGDWSWGLLSAKERRELLLRDAKLLVGAGIPDEGAAQRAALGRLVSDLGNIFQELDKALLGDDLDWLMPIAEHLHVLLGIISDFKEMRKRYEHLLEAARRLHSPRLELMAQLGLGNALLKFGGNSEAREALESAAGLARELNEPREEALALHGLAMVDFSLSNYTSMAELYQQSLSICRALGDRHGEARALAGLALKQHTVGEYDSAIELQSRALAIRREIGDRDGEAHSLGNLAVVHGSMGNDLRSAEMYGQCMMLCRELGDRRGEARSLNGLGIIHSSHGEYSVAVEEFSKVIEICHEIGDLGGESYAFTCLANTYFTHEQYSRAGELHRQALDLYLVQGDRYGEALSLCGLADIQTAKSDLGPARELYLESLSIFVEIGLKDWMCRVCAIASVSLALLGALRPAAVACYGALHQAAKLKIGFGLHQKKTENKAISRLGAAVDSGEISAGELAAWRAEGESLTLDELAQYVLSALRG